MNLIYICEGTESRFHRCNFLEIVKMTNTQKRNIKNVGNRSLGHLLTFQHLFVVISESS